MSKLSGFEIEICEKYATGISTPKLALEYGVTPRGILHLLDRNGIERRDFSDACRKYKIDERYFDEINTELKAYILGLIYADGCVSGTTLQLGLNARDVDILKRIRREFRYDGPLLHNGAITSLTITNKHMAKALIRKGVLQAKSLILKFPTQDIVSDDLLHHFIRGYFDGDGGFCKDVRNRERIYWAVEIQGTRSFCTSLKEYISKSLGIKSTVRSRSNINVSSALKFYRNSNVLRFCDFIYDHASIYLERKHMTYKMISEAA